jgi:hypothetical protein
VVAQLTQKLAPEGITVSFIETVLPEELMAQSNMILFNGVPLEEVLGTATTSASECPSCSCLTGTDTVCRTVVHEGVTHEEIPADLIRQAARIALGLAG